MQDSLNTHFKHLKDFLEASGNGSFLREVRIGAKNNDDVRDAIKKYRF
jgi:hypothetical protein